MAGLKIKINVEAASALSALKKTEDGLTSVADGAKQAGNALKSGLTGQGILSISAQLKQANNELRSLIASGDQSSKSFQDATQRVYELNKVLKDAQEAAGRVSLKEIGPRFASNLATVSSTVGSLAVGLDSLGFKGKDATEKIVQLQAVLALSQGVEGIGKVGKALDELGKDGAKVFQKLVAGIVSATGASTGLATALAATGIGVLAVGIGLAISAIRDYNSKIDETTEKTKKLKEENERLKTALDEAYASSQPNIDRQIQIIKNEEKIKDLEAGGEKNQKKINKLKRENLDLAIQGDKVELATKSGLLTATEELTIKTRIYRNERAKERITIEENTKASEQSAERQKAADNVLFQLKLRNATDVGRKILEINKKFEEDKKTLAEAGITDFTALEKDRQNQINKVYTDAANDRIKNQKAIEAIYIKFIAEGLKKQQELALQSQELKTRAEISGIKDSGARKLAELKDAEAKEIDEQRKLYEKKLIDKETFEKNKANIEAFYANQRSETQTDEQKKELEKLKDFQSQVSETIASAAQAFAEAMVSGTNPFLSVFKVLADSLGNYLIELGKKAIATSKLILALKKAIGTPQGILTGIALIGLGVLLKSAFNKQASKGFAFGGFIDGPGTGTSDSIPARLSRGEYVIRARSVSKYGRDFFDKFNRGIPPPDPWRAIVNRSGMPIPADPYKALVNRSGFAEGGYVDPFSTKWRAIVNLTETPSIFEPDRYKALVNRPLPQTPTVRTGTVSMGDNTNFGMGIIAETKISGQDLKIILSRADRRYSNVT